MYWAHIQTLFAHAYLSEYDLAALIEYGHQPRVHAGPLLAASPESSKEQEQNFDPHENPAYARFHEAWLAFVKKRIEDWTMTNLLAILLVP